MSDRHDAVEALGRKLIELAKGARQPAKLTGATGDGGLSDAGGFDNPMTALGSLIVGGESGAAVELAIGSEGQVLTVVAGDAGLTAAWADATGGTDGSDYLYWTADSSATEPVWLLHDGKLLRR